MKVVFDQVSSEFAYPVDAKTVRQAVVFFDNDFSELIRTIRFGCNTSTTQEGRIVAKGSIYDIRINFCLKNGKSRLQGKSNNYLHSIAKLGGQVDESENLVIWKGDSARNYSLFLLFHELAHLEYNLENNSSLKGKTSSEEELFCDTRAFEMINRFSH